MSVAIPIWKGRVSPVFDYARSFHIVDMDGGYPSRTREVLLANSFPPRRARDLAELGVEVLICGGISRGMAAALSSYGIRVIQGIAGGVDEITQAFADGRLPSPGLMMPGWRGGRRRRFRGGRVSDSSW